MESTSDNSADLLTRADKLREESKYKEAVELYKKALEHGDNPLVLVNIA